MAVCRRIGNSMWGSVLNTDVATFIVWTAALGRVETECLC